MGLGAHGAGNWGHEGSWGWESGAVGLWSLRGDGAVGREAGEQGGGEIMGLVGHGAGGPWGWELGA